MHLNLDPSFRSRRLTWIPVFYSHNRTEHPRLKSISHLRTTHFYTFSIRVFEPIIIQLNELISKRNWTFNILDPNQIRSLYATLKIAQHRFHYAINSFSWMIIGLLLGKRTHTHSKANHICKVPTLQFLVSHHFSDLFFYTFPIILWALTVYSIHFQLTFA